MSSITVFACESQPIAVEGLERVFAACEDVRFCGAAASAAEAIPHLSVLQPDVVLVDQAGGLKNVFQFLTQAKAASPRSQVVLWVQDIAEVECFRALQMGARGILKRTLPIATLLECMRAVGRGNLWIENTISGQVVGFLNRKSPARLTPREQEIVRLVCRGMKNKEIAGTLSITAGTVKVHLMHIFEKTGVKDRFELAVQGRKLLGLTAEDEESAWVPGVKEA